MFSLFCCHLSVDSDSHLLGLRSVNGPWRSLNHFEHGTIFDLKKKHLHFKFFDR